ncbi:MAG: hypothetical protein ACLQBJ_00250 [Bryobacteraceae bacterium]
MFRFFSLACSAILFAGGLTAQMASADDARGDGTWKLVPEKSDFGPQPPPQGELLVKVKTNGPEFQVDQISAGEVLRLVFRSDGKETTNPLPNGGQLKGIYRFENGVMMGELNLNDGEQIMRDRVTYSDSFRWMTIDREWMTVNREPKTTDGSFKTKLVFERVATEHPSMAGTWKLDAAKSDFGGGPVPDRFEAVITVEGPRISMVQTTDQGTVTLNVRDDGEETTNDLGGTVLKSKMRWEGAVLTGENIYTGPGGAITFHDRTSFSPDGKVMTMDRVGVSPSGERHMRLVLIRQ